MVDVSVRGVIAASSRGPALGITSGIAEEWREKGYPEVAEHLEERVEECLALPESHHRRVRTTNGLEKRLNQEIERRTRVVRIFRQACLRLVTALAVEQSDERVTVLRRYLDMEELRKRCSEE